MRIPIIIIAAVMAAAPAVAQDITGQGRVTRQVTVRMSDLDLTTAAGGRAAVGRIARAAGEACGGQPSFQPDLITLSSAYRRCRADAMAVAVAKVDFPAVSRAYAEIRGSRIAVASR
jgi:UrcA family protein